MSCRVFLALLVLASIFFQGRRGSNHAWAKVPGLPPREIGHYERVLGQALEWCLWISEGPVLVQPTTPAAAPVRNSPDLEIKDPSLPAPSSNVFDIDLLICPNGPPPHAFHCCPILRLHASLAGLSSLCEVAAIPSSLLLAPGYA